MKGKTTCRGVYLLSFRCPYHSCHTAQPLLPMMWLWWLFGVILQWTTDSSACCCCWILSGMLTDVSLGRNMCRSRLKNDICNYFLCNYCWHKSLGWFWDKLLADNVCSLFTFVSVIQLENQSGIDCKSRHTVNFINPRQVRIKLYIAFYLAINCVATLWWSLLVSTNKSMG
jgi:hypothetical protein